MIRCWSSLALFHYIKHCGLWAWGWYISFRFKALLDRNNDRNAMVISRNMNGRELMMHRGREQIDFRALISESQSLTIWGSLINDDSHSCDGIKIFPDSYRSGHTYSVYSFGAWLLSTNGSNFVIYLLKMSRIIIKY